MTALVICQKHKKNPSKFEMHVPGTFTAAWCKVKDDLGLGLRRSVNRLSDRHGQ
jgi:hypothetical protein